MRSVSLLVAGRWLSTRVGNGPAWYASLRPVVKRS